MFVLESIFCVFYGVFSFQYEHKYGRGKMARGRANFEHKWKFDIYFALQDFKEKWFFFLNTKHERLEVLYVKSQQEGHGKDFKVWTLCKYFNNSFLISLTKDELEL